MTAPVRQYDGLSEGVNDLIRLGYNMDLTLDAEKDCWTCSSLFAKLSPDKFKID